MEEERAKDQAGEIRTVLISHFIFPARRFERRTGRTVAVTGNNMYTCAHTSPVIPMATTVRIIAMHETRASQKPSCLR